MQYRKFGKLNYTASALGFGTMRLPASGGKIIEPEAIKMLHYAIDQGVNYIDTAYPYHEKQSEVLVGKALQNGYRSKVKLATKMPSWLIKTETDFDRYLDEQLKKLAVEQIDFYLLHALNKNYWTNLNKLDVFKWADKAIASGKIAHLGFSFHDEAPLFKEIVDAYDWAMCLIQYNYMDIYNQAGVDGLRYAASRDIAVVIMEPLLGGRLASPAPAVQSAVWYQAMENRTPVEWALKWLWNQPEVATVLSGMSTMEQVRDNIASASSSKIGELTSQELALFDQARELQESLTAIPCTSCGYCMPCPYDLDIPENFKIYNDVIMYDRLSESKKLYEYWKTEAGDPSKKAKDLRAVNCTGCQECESKCPQNIPISSWMPVIDDVLGEGKPFIKKLE